MPCWRVLELSGQPRDNAIPQLLVKPVFRSNSYTLHLTDLSNIWSEELDLTAIVDRASQEHSPIEVSKQDTAQLAILLEHVNKSLASSDKTVCHIARNEPHGVTLHTIISLPEPLDSLTWNFHLTKRSSQTLKDELILPLLLSSHIQNERITSLVTIVGDKDRAIARLVDQFETNSLDLAAAFPSVGNLKAGRKIVKGEQAAKHVPALRPFREEAWRAETGQSEDLDISTLGLFQEALAQTTPIVPCQLKSRDGEDSWWTTIPDWPDSSYHTSRSKVKKKPVPTATMPKSVVESSDDETEEEFETHENFQTRHVVSKPITAPEPITPLDKAEGNHDNDDSTEDDDDLDAAPRSQGAKRNLLQVPARKPSLIPKTTVPPKASTPPPANSKVKRFRIGGKATSASNGSLSPKDDIDASPNLNPPSTKATVPPSPQIESLAGISPRKARKPFKIGGKERASDGAGTASPSTTPPKSSHTRVTQSPTVEPLASRPPPSRVIKEETPPEEQLEETPEEKAERKRSELKRKNEEAAKKQSQNKKKKRF